MRGLLMGLVLALATATALAPADAKQSPAPIAGHLEATNDGKQAFVPDKIRDANGNPGYRRKAAPGRNAAKISSGLSGQLVTFQTAQGCKITVHAAWAAKFERFFSLLKDAGHHVPCSMVGCYSRQHKPGSNHAIGGACDIQRAWNRGPAFVYHMGPIIRAAGLYDGCAFGDCGHVEAIRGLHNKAPNIYAAVAGWQAERLAQPGP